MARFRRRIRRALVPEITAFAYARCGVTRRWVQTYLEHDKKVLSRGSYNQSVNAQWKLIRRYARQHGLDLRRRFFDAEGTSMVLHSPLPLLRRRELALLFLEATRLGVRTVLVDSRIRLDCDDVIRAVLCGVFREAGIRVIEAVTGLELTDPRSLGDLAFDNDEMRQHGRRIVAQWKWLVSRLKSGSELGRKPFGTSVEEQRAVDRIRELYRVLPRECWRRRRATVLKRRSFRQIAAVLNVEGFPTRTGRPWSGPVVFGILKRLKVLKRVNHSGQTAGPTNLDTAPSRAARS